MVPIAEPPFSLMELLLTDKLKTGVSPVRKFQAVGSSIPANASPSLVPRTTRLSMAHQVLEPSPACKLNRNLNCPESTRPDAGNVPTTVDAPTKVPAAFETDRLILSLRPSLGLLASPKKSNGDQEAPLLFETSTWPNGKRLPLRKLESNSRDKVPLTTVAKSIGAVVKKLLNCPGL